MISLHGTWAYLTISTVLFSYSARVAFGQNGQYVASVGNLDDWVRGIQGTSTTLQLLAGSDFRNPPGLDDIRIIACTERRGDACGGRCWGYQGRHGDMCTPTPEGIAVNCMAATKPVRMCYRQTCDRQCNNYSDCGTRLSNGFCYTPDTHSIQFLAVVNPPQPETTTTPIAGPPMTTGASTSAGPAPVEPTGTSSPPAPLSSSQAPSGNSSVSVTLSESSGEPEDSTELAALPTPTQSTIGQATTSGSPRADTNTNLPSSTTLAGGGIGNGLGTDANGNPIEQTGSTSRISTGAIVGIVFGSLGIIIGAILIFLWLKRRQRREDPASFNPLLMGKSIPLIGASPAPGQTPMSQTGSRSSWYAAVKLPSFGYQEKSRLSRSGSPEYGYSDGAASLRSGMERGTWR